MFAYKREILSAKSESLLKFEITVTPFLFRLDELKEERRQESPLARAHTHTHNKHRLWMWDTAQAEVNPELYI